MDGTNQKRGEPGRRSSFSRIGSTIGSTWIQQCHRRESGGSCHPWQAHAGVFRRLRQTGPC